MEETRAREVISTALSRLSGVCDGAMTEDGMGFNGPDQWLHRVDALSDPSVVVHRAAQALWKYTGRQISDLREDLLTAGKVMAEHVNDLTVSYNPVSKSLSISLDPKTQVDLKDALKEACRADQHAMMRWRPDANKTWSINVEALPVVTRVCEARDLRVVLTSEAQGFIERIEAKKDEPVDESVPEPGCSYDVVSVKDCEKRWIKDGDYLAVVTPFHPKAKDALKAAAPGCAYWNAPVQGAWSVPLEFGLRVARALVAYFPRLAKTISEDPKVIQASTEQDRKEGLTSAASLDDAGATVDEAFLVEIGKRIRAVVPEGFSLYPYQEAGVAFAEVTDGVTIIGDEMGLGKTIQAITWVSLNRDKALPALVVCPQSVKLNWKREIETWMPGARVAVVDGTKGDLPEEGAFDWMVINYDLCSARKDQLMQYGWKAGIIDECQYLKNPKAQRTMAVLGSPARKTRDKKTRKLVDVPEVPGILTHTTHRFALSGTPLLNAPIELWPIAHWVDPVLFDNFFGFAKRYCAAQKKSIGRNKSAWDFSGASNLDELAGKMRRRMVRRLKADVLKDLPPKRWATLTVDLDPKSRARLEVVESQLVEACAAFMEGLEDDREGCAVPPGEILRLLGEARKISAEGKITAAVEWLQSARDAGNPVLVFMHHRHIVDAMREALEAEGAKTVTIDGGTGSKARDRAIRDFQDEHKGIDFALLTTAAAEGITLTRASNCLFVERQWHAGKEDQMLARAHRIGQSESVTGWLMYAECLIDAKFAETVAGKRGIMNAVLDGGKSDAKFMMQMIRNLAAVKMEKKTA